MIYYLRRYSNAMGHGIFIQRGAVKKTLDYSFIFNRIIVFYLFLFLLAFGFAGWRFVNLQIAYRIIRNVDGDYDERLNKNMA